MYLFSYLPEPLLSRIWHLAINIAVAGFHRASPSTSLDKNFVVY